MTFCQAAGGGGHQKIEQLLGACQYHPHPRIPRMEPGSHHTESQRSSYHTREPLYPPHFYCLQHHFHTERHPPLLPGGQVPHQSALGQRARAASRRCLHGPGCGAGGKAQLVGSRGKLGPHGASLLPPQTEKESLAQTAKETGPTIHAQIEGSGSLSAQTRALEEHTQPDKLRSDSRTSNGECEKLEVSIRT